MIFSAVHKGYGIHYNVIVQMGFVQVCSDDRLILTAKELFDKSHADTVRLLRRHLSGCKGLDEVIPYHTAHFSEVTLCLLHLGISCFTALTINGRRKEMLLCFL